MALSQTRAGRTRTTGTAASTAPSAAAAGATVAPPTAAPASPPARALPTEAEATRAFSTSVLVSGVRCGLTYVIFPWILPLLGVAGGVGPAIGLAVGTVAIGFNVASIRRFQLSRHRWRWYITALNAAVIALLVVLVGIDLGELVA